MKLPVHLVGTALTVGLVVVGSACSTTPSDSTRYYSQALVISAEPAQPPATHAALPKSESGAARWTESLGLDSILGHEPVLRASYARSQQGGAAAKPAGGDGAAEIGRKLSNPTSDVWALFTEFDYQKNSGKLTGGDDSNTVGSTMIFQPIMPVPLTENWQLITRPTLPVIFTTPVPDAGGDFDRESGIGNLALPIIPVSKHGIKLGSGAFIGGVGPTFAFPTASNDNLGADVWEAGVAAVGVYKTEKMNLIAFPQYWWSYSEGDDAEGTSHGNLLYAFIYELGNAWQVGTAPTIAYNDKARSGNEWNVPIGLLVAKTMTFGKQHIKFQLAVEYSIVNEDDYGKEVMLRFNVIPVVANPFSGPLF